MGHSLGKIRRGTGVVAVLLSRIALDWDTSRNAVISEGGMGCLFLLAEAGPPLRFCYVRQQDREGIRVRENAREHASR